jgi:hypothetical protein
VGRGDSTENQQVRFLGFGGYGRLYMLVTNEEGAQESIGVEALRSVRFEDGSLASGTDYLRMSYSGALPSCTLVQLETNGGLLEIPADQVASIRKTGTAAEGALIGIAVGLAVDLLLYNMIMKGELGTVSYGN